MAPGRQTLGRILQQQVMIHLITSLLAWRAVTRYEFGQEGDRITAAARLPKQQAMSLPVAKAVPSGQYPSPAMPNQVPIAQGNPVQGMPQQAMPAGAAVATAVPVDIPQSIPTFEVCCAKNPQTAESPPASV